MDGRDVVEQDLPARSRGARAVAVVAGLAVVALAVSRLPTGADEAAGEPLPAASEAPAVAPSPLVNAAPGRPIGTAPAHIRAIELVAASRLALFHGPLDGAEGRTTITGEVPYASDEVTVQAYGTGVVVGPAPGSSTPGTARTTGSTGGAPTEPVAGIVPALEGGSFWVMDAARTAAGDCQMRLVTPDGPVDDAVNYRCDFVPERETVAGFVGRVGSRLDPASGRLLDGDTGVLSSIGGSLLGASDRQVVRWSRDPADPIVVEDLVSADTLDVVLPPGRVARQVALSPDGRYLAVVLAEQLVTIRSYEVWVHDLVDGHARVATVTTLAQSPLDLAWQGAVLVVAGNGVDVYDTATGELYQSSVELMPGRLDFVALPAPLR